MNQFCEMKNKSILAAYYYPGWHPCKVRDSSFPRGWSEWDLVYQCKPRFAGHDQPKIPLWGPEDESNPEAFARKIETARTYGVDAFVFAFYWSRGKRLLEGALNQGLLKAKNQPGFKFALMWANRMPRKVMPVKDLEARVIDPSRLVYTDPEDFVEFVEFVSEKYFVNADYLELNGGKYLSIFDTAFFIRQLGVEKAGQAVKTARERLAAKGLKLHLAAIDPIAEHQPDLKQIGFDSVTHYVFLPDWKGPYLQNFSECTKIRQQSWQNYQPTTGLPYFPSVTPGWDANPRAVDYGKEKPGKYPWSPIIVDNSPTKFQNFLEKALDFAENESDSEEKICFISSWNEWSEGHYLEPDQKHGYAWLEAVKNAKNR
ncbi:MAG: hypothetical protein PWR01_2829 [Clostridiales bacterium]|nr:hypothetical protein [Clostridiales bacterium]MDN5281756.1 hypothetical protein [Candidatus Ozemobacter sp.]